MSRLGKTCRVGSGKHDDVSLRACLNNELPSLGSRMLKHFFTLLFPISTPQNLCTVTPSVSATSLNSGLRQRRLLFIHHATHAVKRMSRGGRAGSIRSRFFLLICDLPVKQENLVRKGEPFRGRDATVQSHAGKVAEGFEGESKCYCNSLLSVDSEHILLTALCHVSILGSSATSPS